MKLKIRFNFNRCPPVCQPKKREKRQAKAKKKGGRPQNESVLKPQRFNLFGAASV